MLANPVIIFQTIMKLFIDCAVQFFPGFCNSKILRLQMTFFEHNMIFFNNVMFKKTLNKTI